MAPESTSLRDRLAHELREYAIAVAYLYVSLGSLLLFEAAVRSEAGVSAFHFGTALGKALILGKFLLIGEAARLGARVESRSRLALIARKVLAFFALLVALSVVEEFVVGWLHGETLAATLAAYEARSFFELGTTCLVLFLVLVPFVATKEIARALGPGRLQRLLREPPD